VFDLALLLTYGARQKDADDEFVLTLVENINKISYASRRLEKVLRHTDGIIDPFDLDTKIS